MSRLKYAIRLAICTMALGMVLAPGANAKSSSPGYAAPDGFWPNNGCTTTHATVTAASNHSFLLTVFKWGAWHPHEISPGGGWGCYKYRNWG